MSPEIIKELRQLQNENTPLKKVVAEQVLNNQILKEAINLSKNAKPGGAVHMDYRTDGETGPWVNTAVRSDMKVNSRIRTVN